MNGKDFYELFQSRWNETHDGDDRMSRSKAEAYCRTLCDALDEQFDAMNVGDRIVFYGFGTFVKRKMRAHRVGDIKNGGAMEIPEREYITFVRAEAKR